MLYNNIYVDNLNIGLNNEEILPVLYKESREKFGNRGFNIRKWVSNSEVIQKLARKKQEYDERESIVVLGMNWGPGDTLSFKKDLKWDGKFTKRSVLAFTNALFDPLNMMLPIAVQCRVFLRELWGKNCSGMNLSVNQKN